MQHTRCQSLFPPRATLWAPECSMTDMISIFLPLPKCRQAPTIDINRYGDVVRYENEFDNPDTDIECLFSPSTTATSKE